MKAGRFIKFLLPVLAASVLSCIAVPNAPLVNENIARSTARFDWHGLTAHPDSMTVLSTRTEKEIHYNFGYRYLYDPVAECPDTVDMVRGEYYSLAFGCEDGSYEFPNIGEFLSNRAFPLRDVIARCPDIPSGVVRPEDRNKDFQLKIWRGLGLPEDVLVNFEKSDHIWDELAPLTTTLEEGHLLYSAVNKSYLDPAGINTISFSPEELTARIRFNLPVQVKSDDIEIVCAFASISGVPSYIRLMSSDIEKESLGKVYMALRPSDTEADVYTGSVRTLGLFSPDSPTFIGGPGILYLYFCINQTVGGVKQCRMSQPVIKNLWSALGTVSSTMANKVIDRREISNQYYLKTHDVEISVPGITVSSYDVGDVKFDWSDGENMEADDSPEMQ